MASKQKGGNGRKHPGKHGFYDYSLLFTLIFLNVFGLVMIYSASSYMAEITMHDAAYFLKRQGLICLGSFVVMLGISRLDYHWCLKWALPAYFMSYVLMILVTLIGKEVNGKRRWLGVGPFSFQPTEFAKVALIIFLAVYITNMGKKINTLKGLIIVFLLDLPIAGIVAMNNLSSGIIVGGLVFVMTFVATRVRILHGVLTALVAAAFFSALPVAQMLEKSGILHEYQLSRIMVWKDPVAYAESGGFQVLQGLYAIGSGGIMGKGLGESIQKLGFVPEAQNDMIFSIICEELGLFGAVSVLLVFMFLIYRCMAIASAAPDMYGALLVVGVMAHISIQVILNVAVVTNSIPNTGITLPFISYGGTSVLFLMVEMGLVLSVAARIPLEVQGGRQ